MKPIETQLGHSIEINALDELKEKYRKMYPERERESVRMEADLEHQRIMKMFPAIFPNWLQEAIYREKTKELHPIYRSGILGVAHNCKYPDRTFRFSHSGEFANQDDMDMATMLLATGKQKKVKDILSYYDYIRTSVEKALRRYEHGHAPLTPEEALKNILVDCSPSPLAMTEPILQSGTPAEGQTLAVQKCSLPNTIDIKEHPSLQMFFKKNQHLPTASLRHTNLQLLAQGKRLVTEYLGMINGVLAEDPTIRQRLFKNGFQSHRDHEAISRYFEIEWSRMTEIQSFGTELLELINDYKHFYRNILESMD